MTVSVLMCFLGTLLHIPTLILRYLPFKDIMTKKQKKILFAIYSITIVLSFLLYLFVHIRYGVGVAYFKLNLFLFCIIAAFVNTMVIKKHLREHLFVFGIVALAILMLFTISLAINQIIGYRSIGVGIIQTSTILIICFCILYVPMKNLIINAVTPFLNIDSKDYWENIWFIPVAMFMASFLAYPMDTYMSSLTQFLSRIMIAGAGLFVCRSISYDYGKFFENEVMGKQIELQKQYYNELARTVENDRRARHDFKHHISAIRSLAQSGDKNALISYCNELERVNYREHIPLCKNAALDGILYHYMTLAKENNIGFSVSCTPEKINISDIDLCVLMGNALSNAFEGAVLSSGQRFINIAVSADSSFVIITVDNSFDGKIKYQGEKILSRKRNNSEGLGISSMKNVCEKYGGSASFKANGNIFEAGFILNTNI